MKLAVIILGFAVACASQVAPYQHGRVIKITSQVRSEGSITPPQGDNGRSQAQPGNKSYGEVFYISIRCGDNIYVAEVKAGVHKFDPGLFSSDRDVRFRTEGQTIYIKPSNGEEFAGRVVPTLGRHCGIKQKRQSSQPE